jgi:hypothetical protein
VPTRQQTNLGSIDPVHDKLLAYVIPDEYGIPMSLPLEPFAEAT